MAENTLFENVEQAAALINCFRDFIVGQYTYRLLDMIIPKGTTVIRKGAFNRCFFIGSVTIPNSVTAIDEEAFQYCSALTTITIPNSVKSIGTYAFSYCASLTTITIPNSVTYVGTTMFSESNNLENVTLETGFNCNNLILSWSNKYSVETIVSWLNALADRTGLSAYTLTIGRINKNKLTAEQIAIATNKNWNLA